MNRKRNYPISIFTLTALAVTAVCNAGTYSPNDLFEGRLPGHDSNIVLNTWNGNFSKKIYLPAYPSHGDTVSISSRATWTTDIEGDILGINSIKVKTNEKIDLVFDSTFKSAWRIKNESTPNTVGSQIPNDKKYVAYYVKDANWANLLHLPVYRGLTKHIVVRSQAGLATYIDNDMIANLGQNLKILKGEYYAFEWNDTKEKWDLIVEQSSNKEVKTDNIRDLTFWDLSVDTFVNGTGLYNNGRMQKPVKIRYKACLSEEADNDDCNLVDLTKEEEQYYLHLGLYGRNDSNEIDDLADNDEIFIDYEKDERYQSNLEGRNVKDTTPTDEQIEAVRGHKTTTFWVRYKAKSSHDQETLNICAFSRWRDENGEYIDDADTQDCKSNGTGSISRVISVIDGNYRGYINNNPDITREQMLPKGVCTTESQCNARPGWRIYNGWTRGISYLNANLFKYSSRRPHHTFRPVENAKSTTLARGCVQDARGGSDSKDDGICTNYVENGGYAGVSFYTTDLQFGSTKTVPISYSTEDADASGFVPRDRDTWQFDTDVIDPNRAGSFSVFSVLPVIDFRSGDTGRFVIWENIDGGHWSASTQNSSKQISSIIEDNYGNRFRFSAKLNYEPNMGAAANISKDYVLSRMQEERFEPIID
ncbi:hypothetical protein [Vibrio sagamiensis]|uniref:Metalloprotease StcE beta-sandwich domain-containing protein n=1 Tax=Vibrio sagamiensis NBRC 104589 TaxID=1219064 RepID=A0A511QD37_9VIBR|nr:hypothetical protein [Vibrio sagamiensis]PNQ53968.1 hypothetical protein C1141_18405 [Vibrio agarivorans]GEM75208.1 hypothetical protein VSA01S_13200 [Vibrio sagamiensis NBRC 104589]